jgi:dTDP-4-amino-4,6-dideoxygalactose transaminase
MTIISPKTVTARPSITLTSWRHGSSCKRNIERLFQTESINNGYYNQKCESVLTELHEPKIEKVLLTSSCTSALEVAALACNLKEGDEVIVPSFTFPSTINAMVLFGANPVFADIDINTGNILPEEIIKCITPKTKAIVVVHYAGAAQNLTKIVDIANEHNLKLIEDNAHGFSGYYNGQPLGTFGDYGALSFHYTKNIGCGEGGALLVNQSQSTAEQIRENGTDRAAFMRGEVNKYDWQQVGINAMLSELSAAVLLDQLQMIDDIQTIRHQVWNTYHKELYEWANKHSIAQPYIEDACEYSAHIYYLRFNNSQQRSDFISYMAQDEIQVLSHLQPLHLSPAGKAFGGHAGQCPNSELLSDTIVRLPLHPYLTESDVQRITNRIQRFTK